MKEDTSATKELGEVAGSSRGKGGCVGALFRAVPLKHLRGVF